MTLHSVMGFEPFEIHYEARTALGPGRPFMLRGCGLATDQKAVRRRGPGRVVLGSKPQLATTEELVSWVELVNWAGSKPQLATTEKLVSWATERADHKNLSLTSPSGSGR